MPLRDTIDSLDAWVVIKQTLTFVGAGITIPITLWLLLALFQVNIIPRIVRKTWDGLVRFVLKIFDGWTKEFYLGHFFWGFILACVPLTAVSKDSSLSFTLYWIISTLLYPFTRFFITKRIDRYLERSNNSFLNGRIEGLIAIFCWGTAMLLAPIGLIYRVMYLLYDRLKKSND